MKFRKGNLRRCRVGYHEKTAGVYLNMKLPLTAVVSKQFSHKIRRAQLGIVDFARGFISYKKILLPVFGCRAMRSDPATCPAECSNHAMDRGS
jgi:hypothetical protein